MSVADDRGGRPGDWFVIAFALVFPTLLTVIYFILLAGQSTALQQGAFAVGKLIQFVFPVLWTAHVQGMQFAWSRPRARDLFYGIALGFGLLAAALAIYYLGLKPAGLFDGVVGEAIREKVDGLGVGNVSRFVALGVFYSLFHSLLEEYYWRWFVFGRLRGLMPLPWAIGVSSLGFMAHHVCIVSTFFGWLSPMSILLSVAVAGGGAIWAWIYHRRDSLWAPWIGHALVDAAIFLVGYDLINDFSAT